MVILAFLIRGVKVVCLVAATVALAKVSFAQDTFIRINQVGYLPNDPKSAVIMSKIPVSGGFSILDASRKRRVFSGEFKEIPASDWGGKFSHYYQADFSKLIRPGTYRIDLEDQKTSSPNFVIGMYPAYQEDLLFFMQRPVFTG